MCMTKRAKLNGTIQLIDICPTEVAEKMSNWNTRYRNYKPAHLSGIWECRELKHSAGILRFQFVNHTYEHSRGLKATEAPILLVSIMEGMSNGTIIKYHLRQQTIVMISMLWYLCFEAVMLFASLWVIQTENVAAGAFVLCAFVFLLGLAVCWLPRKILNDYRTIVVFREILSKNFNANIRDIIA